MRSAKLVVNDACLKGLTLNPRPMTERSFRRASARPALVRPRPGRASQAIVSLGGRAIYAALGRSGIATLKREGDGATPRCRMRPIACLHRDRSLARPSRVLPMRPVRARDGWCDEPRSQLYNRACRTPLRASHETLVREDALYDAIVVTDHNQRPRVRWRGSAVFVHVARDGLAPTAGCLAFARSDWQRGAVPTGPLLVGVDPRRVR